MNSISRFFTRFKKNKHQQEILNQKSESLVNKFRQKFKGVVWGEEVTEVPVQNMPPAVLEHIFQAPDPEEVLAELTRQKYAKLPYDPSLNPRQNNYQAGKFHEILNQEEVDLIPSLDIPNKDSYTIPELNPENIDPNSSIHHMPEAVRQDLQNDEIFQALVSTFGYEEALKLNGLKPVKTQPSKDNLIYSKEGECSYSLFSLECGSCDSCITRQQENQLALDSIRPTKEPEEEFDWVDEDKEEYKEEDNIFFQDDLKGVIQKIRTQIDPDSDSNPSLPTPNQVLETEKWEDQIVIRANTNNGHNLLNTQIPLESEMIDHPILSEIKEVYTESVTPEVLNLQTLELNQEPDQDVMQESESQINLNPKSSLNVITPPIPEQTPEAEIQALLQSHQFEWIQNYTTKKTFLSKFKGVFKEKLSWKTLPKKLMASLVLGGSILALTKLVLPVILTGIITQTSTTILGLIMANLLRIGITFESIEHAKFQKILNTWSDTAITQDQLVKAIEDNNLEKVETLIAQLNQITHGIGKHNHLEEVKQMAKKQAFKSVGYNLAFSALFLGGTFIQTNPLGHEIKEMVASKFQGLKQVFDQTLDNSQTFQSGKSLLANSFQKLKTFGSSFFDSTPNLNSNLVEPSKAIASTPVSTPVSTPLSTPLSTQVSTPDQVSLNTRQLLESPQALQANTSTSILNTLAENTPIVDPVQPISINANLENLPECTIQATNGLQVSVNTEDGRLLCRSEDLQSVVRKLKAGTQLTLTGATKLAESDGIQAIYVEAKTRFGSKIWVAQNFLRS